MLIETEAIISLLELTGLGPVSHEAIKRETRIPSSIISNLLQRLQNEGSINLHENMVEADGLHRLRLAVRAVQAGADIERVSRLLEWKEFEAIAAYGFECNGYHVFRNIRFKRKERRYEIDIAAHRGQLVVCADCKHWRRGLSASALNRIVGDQVRRTLALAEALPSPNIELHVPPNVTMVFVPAILTLVQARFKFCDGVPVVSVLQSQDFSREVLSHANTLKHFRKKMESFRTLG